MFLYRMLQTQFILQVENLPGNKGKFGLHSALFIDPWVG